MDLPIYIILFANLSIKPAMLVSSVQAVVATAPRVWWMAQVRWIQKVAGSKFQLMWKVAEVALVA